MTHAWPGEDSAATRARRQALLERMRAQRLFPPGRRTTCPECRRRTFTGADDLRVELVHDGTVHSFRHLHGARCTRCGAQTLEPYDQAEMEGALAARFTADYAAHVSNVGKGTVGTYWPKDVHAATTRFRNATAQACSLRRSAQASGP